MKEFNKITGSFVVLQLLFLTTLTTQKNLPVYLDNSQPIEKRVEDALSRIDLLAATWNPDMALLYGKSIGEEARYRNKNVLLGPGVNIYRTPLNGRNFEYLGEDPYLASRIVVPYVQGVQSNGVAACVKHFGLNNQEVDRNTVNVVVDDCALYEIYLPPFKAAVVEGKDCKHSGAQYRNESGQGNCSTVYRR